MDRFEAMSLLLRVVEKGSFSAAGRDLRIPLPTLSRKISDLETLLGAKLLIRTTRRLSLTDAGIAYVAAAKRILDQLEDAERAAAGEFVTPKGELVLTAPILFGRLHVLPVVTDFLAAFPSIRLILSDRNVDLIDDHVDMAVRIGALPDSSMVATAIGSMRTIMCASPRLLASHGLPKTPEDLARLPCVTFDMQAPSTSWPMRHSGSSANMDVPIRPRLSVTTAETAVAAAEAGVGVTRVLHYQAADAIARGALRIILPEYESEPLPIHLLHASRGLMPLKMRSFLDFAAPRLRAELASLADRSLQNAREAR
ncbi:DNA-binding transcriptional regulator, LysR family [Sphingomonas sp. YR710]|uniref:LysR family transcriptional regulator n=1 Tax=Sphingomonas sp. YR710 TaxID=1882773 RepID=UPI00087EF2AF|nr:LysR family transcriptional regulator [Sphingomonas sp. YR710]SDC76844.1 DNA-binding transcriptional regulator, LysR family [Sphingomonas sp. YR710]